MRQDPKMYVRKRERVLGLQLRRISKEFYVREYVYFEKISLLFIPLAFANLLFGDYFTGIIGGIIWTTIWYFVRRHNRKVREQK